MRPSFQSVILGVHQPDAVRRRMRLHRADRPAAVLRGGAVGRPRDRALPVDGDRGDISHPAHLDGDAEGLLVAQEYNKRFENRFV